ncbi:MAG: tetratricopeptide repeat protein [Bacteroidota bacterium]
MKRLLILLVMLSLTVLANAQNERRFVRQGNRYYLEAIKDTTQLDTVRFAKAEAEYRKALEKRPHDPFWNFNLNTARYKQMQFEESAAAFQQLADQAEAPVEKARALHNLGNSLLFQQKIDESIEAYKEALRNNPADLDTKYNLAYAQMLKNQQQNQDQQQNQNQQQNQDQQQQNQNQDQQQDQNPQQQQQPPPKISQQNAEQLLQALQNAERDIQEKVKKQQAQESKPARVEKDW